jgi:hypothetical protein
MFQHALVEVREINAAYEARYLLTVASDARTIRAVLATLNEPPPRTPSEGRP